MPQDSVIDPGQYAYTQNRELSWLRFNQRVLEEADDRTNPPLERLKFIAIFSGNLDEFFMVRVGSLFDIALVSPDEADNKSGMTASEQLGGIYRSIPGLIELKEQLYASVTADLARQGVADLAFSQLTHWEQNTVNAYFKSNILPIISPIIIGSRHPAPHLVNKALYAAALLTDKKGKPSVGLVPIPEILPPFFRLEGEVLRYIRAETMILQRLSSLFGAYQVEESCIVSVTRNADIGFDDEKFEDSEEDFRIRVTKLLKKRGSLSAIRLEISKNISDGFLTRLTKLVKVERQQVYVDSCPLNMRYVFELAKELPDSKTAALLHQPYRSRWPENIRPEESIMEQVQRGDKLLFFPFDSVTPFLRLLSEAAEHPDVLSIKITIYRLASSSKIAHTLCRAAENGKEIIVLMELRARFDEANNVSWSKLLEDAGCQVIYGMDGFKCHSKICLITLRGKRKVQYITQIGTGNYNEKTNAMYTDLSIMTASDAIGEDATAFFRNMLVNNLNGDYRELLISPNGIKSAVCNLIDEQIALGYNGYICIKVNSVTEREVIDRLRAASRAGVEVQMIVRGICCILPGVPGETENIHVTSIVGRFLEHARIYCFGKGPEAKVYLSSADLMTRNLSRRVEIACPVHDRDLRDQLLWILSCQLRDTAKASFMTPDGLYCRKRGQQPIPYDSQAQFMEASIHSAAPCLPPKPTLAEKITGLAHRALRGLY
ncbi:polyphosphate kinase 1 [uncultured Oscillibacter sp.]|uniref:polyphosphate kinase 1 n=1 Tax=uncultured Oscillibacter sp. TaxID=876091 RepID=UPI0025D2F871|nr:polyphosphate kinase 1 [uncultured Oscillibacter sp.]